MMLIQPTARGLVPRRALAGPEPDLGAELLFPNKANASANLQILRQRYGDGAATGNSAEFVDIMGALVAPFFPEEDGETQWQYCTINQWIDGTPSEDDLSWKAEYFSNYRTLEDTCGDHTTIGSQYDEAFDDLKDEGCPQDVINWLRTKGQAAIIARKKGKAAEKEGSEHWEKAKEGAKDAINPFSLKSPLFWGLLAAVALLVLAKRPPASRVVVQGGTP